MIKKFTRKVVALLLHIGPRFYDFYYRHLTRLQQGSLGRGLSVPLRREGAKELLIFTKRYWIIHTAIEVAFAKEREREGWSVTIVGCDRAITCCDNMFYGKETELTHRCDYCSYLLRKLCKRTGIRYISMREYLDKHELKDSPLLKVRDYKKIVYASWIRLLRRLNPSKPAEFNLRDELTESCKIIDKFLTHYLDNNRVDEVIMLNGKFFAERLFSEHCKERGIPFITYERGLIKETVMFAKNEPAIPPATVALWKEYRDKPLNDAELRELYAYLDSRKDVGNAELVPMFNDIKEDASDLRREYGLVPEKDIVVLFTNVVWDSSVVGEDTIFNDMFDWIGTTIEYYSKYKDVNLIVRVHPVEVKVPHKQRTRERAADFIRRNFGDIDNLKIIDAEDEVSPYLLMDMAMLGLVYTSSTGFEMALRGKPVIVASNTHYAGTEFVRTPKSREEYIKLLGGSVKPLPEQVEYAERYAHMYFFRHMQSYGDVISQHGTDYSFNKDITSSKILKEAGL